MQVCYGERGLAVRRLSVAQETEGSNPFAHPIFPTDFPWGDTTRYRFVMYRRILSQTGKLVIQHSDW